MGIQNQGELYGEAEYDSLRRENDELKKALGEAHLDIKILKKKLETDALRRAERMSKGIPGNSK
jgi:hypothetical protein